ncbi:MAG: peptidase family protein [Ilumatobacteraceae bacterium]|nr:peptidase family protein [Ilumatobacteraceae bacterium]
MDPPTPVKETGYTQLAANTDLYLKPTELDFGNGSTVILNHSGISNDQVTLSAVSNGGLNALAAADQPDGRVAADVVTTSGAGAHNEAQLRQLLAGATVDVKLSIGAHTDIIDATSSTSDVEVMLELIHLYMASPNVDPVAVQREVADATSTAADPFADQATAAQATLMRARYGDDDRFAQDLTTADIASLDADGIMRAWKTGFGNATGWTFTISGDIDVDEVSDLARQYLGTLPGTGSDVKPTDVTPPPPDGAVVKDIEAGTGDTATLLRLYSMRVPKSVANHVLAEVATEVVSARILKGIREDISQSYSPTASFYVAPSEEGGDDFVELYLEMTAAPSEVSAVTTALNAEITDLATKGPSAAEVQAAAAVVTQRYNYISDNQLCGFMLAEHTGIGGTADDFNAAYAEVGAVSAANVRTYLSTVIPLTRYIEVHALPR